MYDIASEMKKLERELYAANERIKLLEAANSDVHRIANERNAAYERIKELEAVVNDPNALWTNWLRGTVFLPSGIGDVRQYQERIKRLAEAGDAMERRLSLWKNISGQFVCDGDAESVQNWNKAKESKP